MSSEGIFRSGGAWLICPAPPTTVKQLGLTMPLSLLGRADEVIE
jgi:hypothetical protein